MKDRTPFKPTISAYYAAGAAFRASVLMGAIMTVLVAVSTVFRLAGAADAGTTPGRVLAVSALLLAAIYLIIAVVSVRHWRTWWWAFKHRDGVYRSDFD